jgi:predicted Zn finger-like uncharacterized protein
MIITVQCPACETSFPVDPRKVPEGGVKVRCSSCSGIFFVDKPLVPSVADLAPSPDAMADLGSPEVAAPASAAASAAAPTEVTVPSEPTADPPAAERRVDESQVEASESADEEWHAETSPSADEAWHAEASESADEAWAVDAPAAEAPGDEPAEARADSLEDARSEPDDWSGTDLDDPSAGVHHDHGSPDPWAGGLDLPEVDESPDEAIAEAEVVADPVVERLETVDDATRAAAAEFPKGEPLDDPDDAWGDPAPAAEAPVAPFGHDDPSDSAEPMVHGSPASPEVAASSEAPAHLAEAGGNVEVAVPAAAAPAPSKFQFGRRDPDEKARRLARVLVSDIITYNPERHQRALEQDTLHADFEDEIRKSWAEYVEQVGQELAEATPYWFDALNEILARGQKVF